MGKARRFLKEFHPDVMHSHSFHANFFARILGAINRTPVISTVHNVYEGGCSRMLIYALTDRMSHKTVAVSDAVAERFLRLHAISRRRCRVIRNAIEAEEFAPNAQRRTQMRNALGVTQEFVWLALGRDAPAKDYPTLLRAFERVRSACSEAQLWIAGAEYPVQDPQRSITVRLGNSIRWLGRRSDVAGLLDAADGFVMSSAWEGMPLAVAEARAMEKLVVGTDVGGVHEFIGDAAMLVAARDPEPLARAMITAMEMGEKARRELGTATRKRIAGEFNMAKQAEEWERLYGEAARQ